MREKSIKFLRLFLCFVIALIAFDVDYRIIFPGLDSSHYFAINYFVNHGIIFGRDVVWTYGPLGFLVRPMDVGSNLNQAILFQVGLWLIFSGTLVYIILKRRVGVLQLGLFAVFFSFSRGIYSGAESTIAYLVLLSLAVAYLSVHWEIFFTIALLFTTVLWFIKADYAFLATSAVISYLLFISLAEKRKIPRALVLAVICFPLLFVASYLAYNNSLADLMGYLRGFYELSLGYGVASVNGDTREMVLALFFFIAYLLLLALHYQRDKKIFFIAATFFFPLLFAFKRGFVRHDTHVLTFFSLSFFVIALNVLFLDFSSAREHRKFLLPLRILSSIFLLAYVGFYSMHSPVYFAGQFSLRSMRDILHVDQARKNAREMAQEYLRVDKLPDGLLHEIGTESIGIFPWEAAYAAANKLTYAPFPVFQAYSAYTPYLDSLNAHYINDSRRAPHFILMEWKAIDGRHPLVDVPAMWLSMYRWYDVQDGREGLLLLRRRARERFRQLSFIEAKEFSRGDTIPIPSSDNPIVVKIFLKHTLLGHLGRVLYKVPEVAIELFSASQLQSAFRVIPGTLQDGVWINHLPLGLEEMRSLMEAGFIRRKIDKIKLSGEGLRYYQDRIRVEYYIIPEIAIESGA
jgi:hypothetical protein